ncbi:hypothetical protein AAHE18_18G156900 [Arachis hypogaea]
MKTITNQSIPNTTDPREESPSKPSMETETTVAPAQRQLGAERCNRRIDSRKNSNNFRRSRFDNRPKSGKNVKEAKLLTRIWTSLCDRNSRMRESRTTSRAVAELESEIDGGGLKEKNQWLERLEQLGKGEGEND